MNGALARWIGFSIGEFSQKLRRCPHFRPIVLSVSLCRIISLLRQVSSERRLSSILTYIWGQIWRNSSVLFDFFLKNISFFLILYLAFGKHFFLSQLLYFLAYTMFRFYKSLCLSQIKHWVSDSLSVKFSQTIWYRLAMRWKVLAKWIDFCIGD